MTGWQVSQRPAAELVQPGDKRLAADIEKLEFGKVLVDVARPVSILSVLVDLHLDQNPFQIKHALPLK